MDVDEIGRLVREGGVYERGGVVCVLVRMGLVW
jgi:hypothetical protein